MRSRLALDVAQVGTWSWDPDRDTVQADARCREVFGLDPDGPLGLADVARHVHAGDRAQVEAAIGTVVDVTERARAELHARFLLCLGDELGALGNPTAILRHAIDVLGRHLTVHRCYFVDLNRVAGHAAIREVWQRDDAPSVVGTYRTADFWSPEMWEAFAAGPVGIDDVRIHPLTRAGAANVVPLRIESYAIAPFVRDGRLVASLTVTDERPRAWRTDELRLLETVVARSGHSPSAPATSRGNRRSLPPSPTT